MNTDPLTPPSVPAHAAVLAALRHIGRRQVVRHRHDPIGRCHVGGYGRVR